MTLNNSQARVTMLSAVLPRPPPLTLRRYEANESAHAWLAQVAWGLVYSASPHLFEATAVRLVQIVQVDDDA